MPFNSQEYAALWARRAGAVTPQVRRAVRQLGQTMLRTSEGYMTADIYSIPEDVSPMGKPLWRRTGQLAHREQIEYTADGSGFRLVNDTPYAEPRHEAGKPGRRPTRRPAPWRDRTVIAILRVKPQLMEAMQQNILAGNAAGSIPSSTPSVVKAMSGGSFTGASRLVQPEKSAPSGGGGGGGSGFQPPHTPKPKKQRGPRFIPIRRRGRR